MAIQTTTGGGVYNNNIGTILHAGTISSNKFNSQSLGITGPTVFSDVQLAVSPAASGQLGTIRPLTGSQFAVANREGNYIIQHATNQIAGVANNTLLGASADFGYPRGPTPMLSARRYDITSWDYVTGVATKGVNAGASYNFHDADGGGLSDDAFGRRYVPAEFVYLHTGGIPTQADFNS